ncbi:MAG TPA: CoA transferase [Allosphingosinicella sp.]|nr:CoA transferase [Allosphingosinicella sp.]
MRFDPPLAGISVVDCVRGPLAPTTRYLAELGATVVRLADPADGADIDAATANAGKNLQAIAPQAEAAHPFLSSADIIVENVGLALGQWRAARPQLVTMTVSDFGTGNSYSDWQASDAVLHALSGELCRSGIRGKPPLLPPHGLAYQCAAAQAAYALIASLYRALRTGEGDHLDFSALEGAVQTLDPGYGVGGSATLGRPAKLLSRDRPVRGMQYPILPCADGHVRICLLAPRQWQGMFRWMGEPEAFADPSFQKTATRYKSPSLLPAIAAFFADKTRRQLEEEGQRHGVPIAAMARLEEAIEASHFAERKAFGGLQLADGRTAAMPAGAFVIDGARGGAPGRSRGAFPPPSPAPRADIFEGLRVLDLGVIVVGAETARLLGDRGADVVKIESRAFPDGNRQSYLPYEFSVSFAAGHRNKRSLGLDLRDARGRQVFLDLAARADIILSNFKPGTMASLGLDDTILTAVNDRIITIASSAFGATGPWSKRMGYGPLVRAVTGLSERWRYRDDPEGFSDSLTIYPDHVAARVGAMAAVALLIRRLRSGKGGHVDIAQAEVMFAQFAGDVARASLGAEVGDAPDRPWGVYRTRGEDDWCVVSVRDDEDWNALAPFIGLSDDGHLKSRTGRLAASDRIDDALAAWMGQRDAATAMRQLQEAKVPAAIMLRVPDLPGFGFYAERGFYRVETHPYLDEEVINEASHVRSETIAAAAARPAPLAGEQTEDIVRDWLGLPDERMQDLIAGDVLQPTPASVYRLIEATLKSRAEAREAT